MNKTLGATFLITGTCIGAGMLALPVATAGGGFYYSIILLFCVWALMYYTGLLVLEANINLPSGSNFISMSKATLGGFGAVVTWLTYLLMLYSLMAAYLSGAGDLLYNTLGSLQNIHPTTLLTPIPLLLLVSVVIYLGARFVDYLGRVLLFGLIITYILLVVLAAPHVKLQQLSFEHSKYLFLALTIAATSFGFHIIIPSLRVYLRDDVTKLKRAILLGSLTPLVVYILWELIIFGIIPIYGAHGLLTILKYGNPASKITNNLAMQSHGILVTAGSKLFVFFAIASSFLGVAFSLFDFLSDGLSINKTILGKGLLALITFLPPFVFVQLYPHGFIIALSYAGVFVAILHGILPALMVWRGRKNGTHNVYKASGGRLLLSIIIMLCIIIIVSQLMSR